VAVRRYLAVGAVAIVVVAAGVTARATSAAPARAAGARSAAGATTTDVTYSCHVRADHYVDVYATNTYTGNRGKVDLSTLGQTSLSNGIFHHNTQATFEDGRKGFRVKKSACKRVSTRVPLTSKGIGGYTQTSTPSKQGHVYPRCTTKLTTVLVRFQLELTNGVPTHGIIALRDPKGKGVPLTLVDWRPKEITARVGSRCVELT
jgi:hypothetical protein